MWRAAWILAVAGVLPACSSNGNDPQGIVDSGIETFPDEGNTHVAVGTTMTYDTDPPTSGSHYPVPQPGGFYASAIPAGYLVHSLEHGAVVVYYDAAVVPEADLAALEDLAAAHPGNFSQVVCVPRSDSIYPVILTAWTRRLRLTQYDQTRIDGFVALFLGQGPERQ